MTVTPLRQMAIETRHLSKRFGEVTALDDINLCIARGEFVAIMGASGSADEDSDLSGHRQRGAGYP